MYIGCNVEIGYSVQGLHCSSQSEGHSSKWLLVLASVGGGPLCMYFHALSCKPAYVGERNLYARKKLHTYT